MSVMQRIVATVAKAAAATHVGLYRRTKGRFGGQMRGFPVLILTTTGRKSGVRRARPIGYLPDGEQFVVVGSNGGSDRESAWALNLKSNPSAQVEIKERTTDVEASEVTSEDYGPLWTRFVAAYPVYAGYPEKTDRRLPLFRLVPVPDGAR